MSIIDPGVYLAGASGGVYALITAHLANIISNWSEMEFAPLRLLTFLVVAGTDVGVAVYYRYYTNTVTKVNQYQYYITCHNNKAYAAYYTNSVTKVYYILHANIISHITLNNKALQPMVALASHIVFFFLPAKCMSLVQINLHTSTVLHIFFCCLSNITETNILLSFQSCMKHR